MVEPASIDDAQEILALQQAAFREVAESYDDFTIPPLTETLDDTRLAFSQQTFLKVTMGGRIIGSIRAYHEGDVCYVGRLIVEPAYRRQGIGTALLLSIEGAFPESEYYELFTGHQSEETLCLYERLGYEEVGREPATDKVTHIRLRKKNPTGGF
ncbi:GNAT family N-acetyltransferase [Planctomycetota bacterium]